MKRVACVLGAGVDGAGGNSLGYHFSKVKSNAVKFDVFAFSKSFYIGKANRIAQRLNGLTLFDDFDELSRLCSDYDEIFVLTPAGEKDCEDYRRFLERMKNEGKLLWWFCLDRSSRTIKKRSLGEDVVKLYDSVNLISDVPKIEEFFDSCGSYITRIDCNFFDYRDGAFVNLPFEKRYDHISYFGRLAHFKDGHHLINEFDSFKSDMFTYTLQGVSYLRSNSGAISTTLGGLEDLCLDKKEKKFKPQLQVHWDYEDFSSELSKDFLHVFPSYDVKSKNKRCAQSMFSIYPVGYRTNVFEVMPRAIEYVMLESILFGSPLILHSTYGAAVRIGDSSLIDYDAGVIYFDDFCDIEKLTVEYMKSYNKNVEKMQRFFFKHYDNEGKLNMMLDALEEVKEVARLA